MLLDATATVQLSITGEEEEDGEEVRLEPNWEECVCVCVCVCVWTFAWRGAAVVLQARAVLALVVFGTLTDVVGRHVETLTAILTGSVEAVVDIQLWTDRTGQLRLTTPFL